MKTGKIYFGEKSVTVEIAETLLEKARGLSGREYLGHNHGMLFIFSFESIHPFTMRGMLFPLDIVWLNRFEEIVHITKGVKPCRSLFCPTINIWKRAKYVLEINAGEADKLGLEVGDKATTSFL